MNKLLKIFFDRRGYDEEYIERINKDVHGFLLNIDELAVKLHELYKSQERVVILPDFDMDGIMSGVLGFAGLCEMGFNVSLFMPSTDDGYGFNENTIDRLISEYPDVKTILTCDVGTSCYDGIKYARKKGIDVLVTDHHKPTGDIDVLMCNVLVNPYHPDDNYELKGICGAHVLYQCLEYYARKYMSTFTIEQIMRLRVFAGIGTISDNMPLYNENRVLVKDSIDFCKLLYADNTDWFLKLIPGSEAYRSSFYGLFEILRTFTDYKKIKDERDINEELFGFYLAPTFNSVKRLNRDIDMAFGVFFLDNKRAKIESLIALNDIRKSYVDEKLEMLKEIDQPYAPYIWIGDIDKGIAGLVAMKLMNETGLPTCVISEDEEGYSGSGRSPGWFKMQSLCVREGFHLAGHELAFGISLDNEDEVRKLYNFLDEQIQNYTIENPDAMVETCDIVIDDGGNGDTRIDVEEFDDFLYELKKYAPFGTGFRKPEIKLIIDPRKCEFKLLGEEKKHLKITTADNFEVLLWNRGPESEMLMNEKELELHGQLGVNWFNDRKTINFMTN